MPVALLLAMQAAGMIFDYFGTQNQARMMGLGEKVNQAGIESNIALTRAATEDESLQAMVQLRKTMGSQIAAMAARGTSTSAGSALSLMTESVSNFNANEKVRRLNAMGKENQLRAGSAMSRLQNMSDTSKLWNSFAQRTISKFPSSFSGWQGVASGTSQGFGLTSAGS